MRGLVLHTISHQSAILGDNTKFVCIDNGNAAQAIQAIQKIVFLPRLGQLPLENRDCFLKQIAPEVVNCDCALTVDSSGIKLRCVVIYIIIVKWCRH